MGRGAESDRDGLPNSFEGEVHVPLNSGEVGRTTMPISDKHIYIYMQTYANMQAIRTVTTEKTWRNMKT